MYEYTSPVSPCRRSSRCFAACMSVRAPAERAAAPAGRAAGRIADVELVPVVAGMPVGEQAGLGVAERVRPGLGRAWHADPQVTAGGVIVMIPARPPLVVVVLLARRLVQPAVPRLQLAPAQQLDVVHTARQKSQELELVVGEQRRRPAAFVPPAHERAPGLDGPNPPRRCSAESTSMFTVVLPSPEASLLQQSARGEGGPVRLTTDGSPLAQPATLTRVWFMRPREV
ncbi:hypothetical protein [Amycolatopsis sp. FDAARGOS 1241]|uniref:hypothetical protein n=1 Tax=Amycolatopsis sp. FDAARGOS 1241 TaxID=2778070 RepID=UPI00194F91BE|nr:hypothetical protein [Amycolatopsis sp. FDAARGOS 1241]QRP44718.1 hypothetical protein I6J71_36635 [Amycolatopsis sp. FDAARGOS 1241]